MGLFSFLTGKKESPAADRQGPARSAVAEAPVPAPAAAPAADAAPVQAKHETPAPEGSPWDHTPFTPPEAWNTEALTAPVPSASVEPPPVGPLDPEQTAALQAKIVDVIKTVYDPEIPVDIYELGLIYEIIVDAERRVLIKMTLTSPACPSAQQIPSEVRFKVKAIPEVTDAWVEIVWEPPWSKDRMSEAAKLTLGFF